MCDAYGNGKELVIDWEYFLGSSELEAQKVKCICHTNGRIILPQLDMILDFRNRSAELVRRSNLSLLCYFARRAQVYI